MQKKLAPPSQKSKYPVSLIIEAVTYRTPMPVTKVLVFPKTSYPICPRCDISFEREYMCFCDRCGQKLNWDLFDYAQVVRPGSRKK